MPIRLGLKRGLALSPPLVSVVVEGYNDSRALGSAADTMEALTNQIFPLDRVEVVLVGSIAQAELWKSVYSEAAPFCGVKAVGADGAHYYELKNRGAQQARGEIIALTDSDVCPEPSWISAIVSGIQNGADVVAGITLFRGRNGWEPSHAVLQAAASISWGFIVGKGGNAEVVLPRGFLSHNVGFRAATFRQHPYRTDLGRTCAGSLLCKELRKAGAKIRFQPEQRVVHNFSFGWWVWRLHRRFGYEVFLLRRLDESYPMRWFRWTKPLEPVVTMGWHQLLDMPQWFRFSTLVKVGRGRRFRLLPLVLAMSLLARGAEMVGMYATLLAPDAMKRFGEST